MFTLTNQQKPEHIVLSFPRFPTISLSICIFIILTWCDNGDGITINLKENTMYYIAVVQQSNTGSYTLKIGAQKPHIEITNCESVSDSTQFTDQRNYYIIAPQAAGNYKLSLATSGNAEFTIYIYNTYMEELGKKTYCRNGSSVDLSLYANTIYYIVVEQQYYTGSYTIKIDKP